MPSSSGASVTDSTNRSGQSTSATDLAVAPQTTTATGQAIPRSAIKLKWFIPRYVAPWYDPGVKVDKLSVSFDPDLGDAVRAAAKRSGRGLSGWLAEAAGARLRA